LAYAMLAMPSAKDPPRRADRGAPIDVTPTRPTRAALVFAGVLLLLFAPALAPSQQFIYRDTGRMHAPNKQFIAAELSRGHVPEWNPYNGLGAPLVASATDAVQHPFDLLLLILPFGGAFKLWVLLSYLLAAMGAWAWARTLGCGEGAAVAAGLAFSLSGVMVSASDNLTYLTAYATAPWVLAAGQWYVTRGGWKPGLAVAAASALCAAAGDPQSWGIAVLAAGLLPPLAASAGERRRALARAGSFAAVAAFAALPFVLPVALWLPYSSRAGAVSERAQHMWNMHPLRLVELLTPGLFRSNPADPLSGPFEAYCGNDVTAIPWFLSVYLGTSTVALAILGARRSRHAALALLLAALFAWAALGPYAGFDRVARFLPLLSRFRYAEKLVSWTALFVAIAAAFGAQALVGAEATARRFGRILAVFAAGAGLVFAACALAPGAMAALVALGRPPAAADMLVGRLRDAALQQLLVLALLALCSVAIARGRFGGRTSLVVCAVIAIDLLAANVSAYVVGPAETEPPPLAAPLTSRGGMARVFTPYAIREDRWPDLSRVENAWRWSYRTLTPTWNVPLRIGNPTPYGPLDDGRLERIVAQSSIPQMRATLSLWDVGWIVVPGDPSNAQRAGLSPPYQVAAIDRELPAFLVEMPHRGRVYVETRVRQVDSEGAWAFVTGADPEGSVVEAPIPGALTATRGAARIAADAPERTEVESDADGAALLVLNDGFAPGWRAEVDGVPAEIVRANWAVRGVFLAPGAHKVTFTYRTPGWRAAWGLVGAAALALAAGWWIARRRRARPGAGAPEEAAG
jgi:hypothetical protein